MSDWRPEHDNALKAHLDAGLSAMQAATELVAQFGIHRSRNSVIGRARRKSIPLKASQTVLNARAGKKSLRPKNLVVILGTPPKFKRGRKPNATPPQRPDVAIRKAASAPKLGSVSFVPRPDPRPGAVPLLELVPDGCRWPSGDGAAVLFCNDARISGKSYCQIHHDMATTRDYRARGLERPDFQALLRRCKGPSALNLQRDFQAGGIGGDE